jgi:hypothetical protein
VQYCEQIARCIYLITSCTKGPADAGPW